MSTVDGASGAGAPTDAQGQQPTTTTPAAQDSSASGASSNPSTTTSANSASGTNSTSSDIQNPEAKRYADEAAQHRKRARELEAELKKYQDAQLTEQQKRERDFADLQAKAFEQETKLQQQALRLAGYEHGASLGISDIKAALALVQAEHGHELKYGDDGTPENISDLLKAVIKEHPILAATTTRQQAAATSSGGATNPGRHANTGNITRSSIAAMSPQERILRNKDILAAMAANGGRLPD